MFLILHNPLAKNNKAKKNTKKILNYLRKNKVPFIIKSSLKVSNLNNYLEMRPMISKLLIIGGDGSINYLVNHVDFSKITQEVYLIKSGSGNDFLRTLKPIRKANVNIFQANTNNGKFKFANGCGLGLDALVCQKTNTSKIKNKFSYLLNAIKSIIEYKPCRLTLNIDNQIYNFKKCYFISAQNGKYFGGGMKITPKADLADNKIDVIVVHDVPKFFVLLVFASIYFGAHTALKKFVFYKKATRLNAKMENKMYLQTDGDVHEGIDTIAISHNQNIIFNAFTKDQIKKIQEK